MEIAGFLLEVEAMCCVRRAPWSFRLQQVVTADGFFPGRADLPNRAACPRSVSHAQR